MFTFLKENAKANLIIKASLKIKNFKLKI